jgi:hypothetical protein
MSSSKNLIATDVTLIGQSLPEHRQQSTDQCYICSNELYGGIHASKYWKPLGLVAVFDRLMPGAKAPAKPA